MSAEFEDRLLLHLQQVIGLKLRRGESCAFTFRVPRGSGYGTTIVWLSKSSTLVFTYSGGRVPSLNRQWLEVLMHAANSPSGLYVVHEPDDAHEQLTDVYHEDSPALAP